MSNTEHRRENAEAALQAYWEITSGSDVPGVDGTPSEQASLLTDILTDLRHWARCEEVDFEKCLTTSEVNFNVELEEEEEEEDAGREDASPLAWINDVDHAPAPDLPTRVGLGRNKDQPMPHRWRVKDDDGVVCYEGRSNDCTSQDAFAPLDFAQADVGATSIEYLDKSGRWVVL